MTRRAFIVGLPLVTAGCGAGYGVVHDGGHTIAPVDMTTLDPSLLRQEVAWSGKEKPGSIFVNVPERRLYLVQAGGRQCGCGRRGCLETYVSATGLCRTLFELLADSKEPSPLRAVAYQDLTAKRIYEAARSGDPIALEAFDRTARTLGLKLADAVAHTGPEAIFLFGGMAAAGDLLLEPAQAYMDACIFPAYRNHVRLLPSRLEAGSSAILGAAALIWNELP